MSKDESFGKRLACLRKERGLTQPKASKKIGVSLSAYQNYEAGHFPNASNIKKLINFYNCNYEWLINGGGKPFNKNDDNLFEALDMFCDNEAVEKNKDEKNHVAELMDKAHEVLKSNTTYAKALAQNIEAFHQAIRDTESVENRIHRLERRFETMLEDASPKKKHTA